MKHPSGELTRREFLKLAGFLGVSAAGLGGFLAACSDDTEGRRVAIVGAGAAGLTAGFLLDRAGWDFEVFEASTRHGGRVQRDADFVDYPIDLGGEWIQTARSILNEISQDGQALKRAEAYRPMSARLWDGERLRRFNSYATDWRGESRFTSSTWWDFFNDFIAPPVVPKIEYSTPVTAIDYSGTGVVGHSRERQVFDADHVIFTAPVRVLLDGDVLFTPELPEWKTKVFGEVDMPPGIKVFIEFAERFYPDIVVFDDPPAGESERIYYDVSLDKDTSHRVLGLFAVGDYSYPYVDFESDDELIAYVLAELDEMFDGAASRAYLRHRVKNWLHEPYIRGAYSFYDRIGAVATIGQSVDDRIFFAGEAYNTQRDWGFVHTAARAAYDTVDELMQLGSRV